MTSLFSDCGCNRTGGLMWLLPQGAVLLPSRCDRVFLNYESESTFLLPSALLKSCHSNKAETSPASYSSAVSQAGTAFAGMLMASLLPQFAARPLDLWMCPCDRECA